MSLEFKSKSADDFLEMGNDSMNPNFGPRYVKYSDKKKEHGFMEGETYFGEWSTEFNRPLGRGIQINNYSMFISHWDFGVTGKYITIYNDGAFIVGEKTTDEDQR